MPIHSLLIAALLTQSPDARLAELDAGVRTFQNARAKIEREVGKDQALQLAYRLIEDQEIVERPVAPAKARAWNETLDALLSADIQGIESLASGTPHPLSLTPGLYETFVPSSVDGRWLPFAVYVPRNVSTHAPLAVLLHGNPQTETQLLSPPIFRQLAERTGTILVAPWGTSDYHGRAERDVYDVLKAAQRAFESDPARTYLVGYSMGGFSVFNIGPGRANWSAAMDISGAMEVGAVDRVSFAWRATPVYIVVGKRDAVVPPAYAEETASSLPAIGVPASFYEQPDGDHRIPTLAPALTAAWMDMHAGIVHSGSIPPMRKMPGSKLMSDSFGPKLSGMDP